MSRGKDICPEWSLLRKHSGGSFRRWVSVFITIDLLLGLDHLSSALQRPSTFAGFKSPPFFLSHVAPALSPKVFLTCDLPQGDRKTTVVHTLSTVTSWVGWSPGRCPPSDRHLPRPACLPFIGRILARSSFSVVICKFIGQEFPGHRQNLHPSLCTHWGTPITLPHFLLIFLMSPSQVYPHIM